MSTVRDRPELGTRACCGHHRNVTHGRHVAGAGSAGLTSGFDLFALLLVSTAFGYLLVSDLAAAWPVLAVLLAGAAAVHRRKPGRS